jgi:hypothetical protein
MKNRLNFLSKYLKLANLNNESSELEDGINNIVLEKAASSKSNYSEKKFKNEIGNSIRVLVKKTKDNGTNFKTKEKSSFDAIKIVITGPTSTSENIITIKEAEVLLDCLHKVLGS